MKSTSYWKNRAEQIRQFVNRRSTDYVAQRFKKVFEVVSSHSCAVEQSRPSRPGTPREAIRDTREKAFQRALFRQGSATISESGGESQIEWLDYELPVLPGLKARRHACDLIARFRGNETICEVKYAPPQKSSPSRDQEFAVFELLFQLQAVALNVELLGGIRHVGPQFRPFTWARVAAADCAFILGNRSWWSRAETCTDERLQSLIASINEEIGLKIILLRSEDVSFPATAVPYVPTWPEEASSTLTEVLRAPRQ